MRRHAHDRAGRPAGTRRRRGPGPIVAVVLGATAAMAAWRAALDRDPGSPYFRYDPQRSRFVDVAGAASPLYLVGDASADALLVVGDSRAATDVSLRVLAEQGVEPAAILWNGFAQLEDLLRAVRALPQRRVLVCLSPTSLYVAPMKRQELILERERAKRWTDRIDEELDDALDVARRRAWRTVQPSDWQLRIDLEAIQPDRHRGLYEWLLGEEFRAERERRFALLASDLRALRDAGRAIACVRLPTQDVTEEIESRTFPSSRFADLCRELDVPFLDLFGRGWQTSDGSHLLGRDADAMSLVLAEWLRTLPQMGFAADQTGPRR